MMTKQLISETIESLSEKELNIVLTFAKFIKHQSLSNDILSMSNVNNSSLSEYSLKEWLLPEEDEEWKDL